MEESIVTPTQGMVAKIPVLGGETNTSTIMTYGYNPKVGKWSPFHGALYAVVESVCKLVAIEEITVQQDLHSKSILRNLVTIQKMG